VGVCSGMLSQSGPCFPSLEQNMITWKCSQPIADVGDLFSNVMS
jgi:hypothetical protein